MATPYKNGITTIIKNARNILKMAAAFSHKWPGFLSPEDAALLDDLVSCCNVVIAALERSEYRP